MSRTGRITAQFGGEERDFCLRWGELIELQEKRDAGPDWILAKIMSLQYRLEDVAETIRLGLIGGGTDSGTAARLVRQYVEGQPYNLGGDKGLGILAVKILSAATRGAPDEPLGKANGEANGSTTSLEARSDSDPSSAMPS